MESSNYIDEIVKDTKEYIVSKFKSVKSFSNVEVLCNFDLLVVQVFLDVYSDEYFEDKVSGRLTNAVDHVLYDSSSIHHYYPVLVREELINDYMVFILAHSRSSIVQ